MFTIPILKKKNFLKPLFTDAHHDESIEMIIIIITKRKTQTECVKWQLLKMMMILIITSISRYQDDDDDDYHQEYEDNQGA